MGAAGTPVFDLKTGVSSGAVFPSGLIRSTKDTARDTVWQFRRPVATESRGEQLGLSVWMADIRYSAHCCVLRCQMETRSKCDLSTEKPTEPLLSGCPVSLSLGPFLTSLSYRIIFSPWPNEAFFHLLTRSLFLTSEFLSEFPSLARIFLSPINWRAMSHWQQLHLTQDDFRSWRLCFLFCLVESSVALVLMDPGVIGYSLSPGCAVLRHLDLCKYILWCWYISKVADGIP